MCANLVLVLHWLGLVIWSIRVSTHCHHLLFLTISVFLGSCLFLIFFSNLCVFRWQIAISFLELLHNLLFLFLYFIIDSFLLKLLFFLIQCLFLLIFLMSNKLSWLSNFLLGLLSFSFEIFRRHYFRIMRNSFINLFFSLWVILLFSFLYHKLLFWLSSNINYVI